MSYVVYLDAGHGGYDIGATYNDRKEKDDNLRLAMAVGNELRNRGIETEFTRVNDIYQSPNEKAQLANADDADLFVSLHRSSSPLPNTNSGVSSVIYNSGDEKEQLARQINDNLEQVGFKNAGVDVRQNLTVLKKTNMPAVLVDVGFINTDSDNNIFDQQFNRIVEGIADAIEEFVRNKEGMKPSVSYSIQVGLFKNYQNAVNLQNMLLEAGYNSRIVPMGGYTAVLVGNFTKPEEAEKIEEKLISDGYETIIIER